MITRHHTFTPDMVSSRLRIDIATLEVMQGELPSRALSLVKEWAMINREQLREDWRLCRESTPEPLP